MGNNTKNIIEINGKRYDAVSGALLGATTPTASHTRPHTSAQSVDGFRRVTRASIPSEPLRPILQKIAEPVTTAPQPAVAIKKHAVHTPAKHASAHMPQPATTLMRSAVTKPDIKSPAHIKAQARTDLLAKVPSHLVNTKLSQGSINNERLKRATRIIQSPAVSRYAQPAAHVSHTTVARVAPVIPGNQSRNSMDGVRAPQPTHHSAPAPQNRDMFSKALANAKSHEQTFDEPVHSRKSRRRAKMATMTLSALLLIAFFGYQNLPNLNMRVAAARAGISAKMPGYKPSGFAFSKLSYAPGVVTVSFDSHQNGNQEFNVSQKASNWDSQALLTNFVASSSKTYRTYERAGRTVYLYGNNTATWVDNGIWYTVDGNSSLTADQLLDVVTSI